MLKFSFAMLSKLRTISIKNTAFRFQNGKRRVFATRILTSVLSLPYPRVYLWSV